ncbi:MAG: ABC transporter ATP-binding protein [Lentisphaeria bacterium]|jgi:putative ABC transport system ATP-binding protein|nr:ABC transporter ATP-binding protein [Lentisphaeria bacterium]MDP7743453.1 ABC transporter ATP-binding protein [Lentisphaeria bacterium]
MAFISIRGIEKTFALGKTEVRALKGIDLEVHRGEYLSIMGPSGSGKSTLFNMIGALDAPSAGDIEVAGHRLNALSRRQLAYFRCKHIGYVFQSFNLIAAYDTTDNVAMPLVFSGQTYQDACDRARTVLSRVGLEHRLTHLPDELSGGQQQRVAIARALANQPAIILADEPTANLDLQTGGEIIALLKELSGETGTTVITTTHDHEMLAVSDRIVWIKDGQVDRVEKREDIAIKVGTVG